MLHALLLLTSLAGGSPGLPPTGSALRDDWPRWGGPARNGVSREAGWSSQGREQPLWKGQIGIGYSSCAVSDGRLYTLGYDADLELDVVYCLDAATGEERWTHAYESEIWDLYHGGGTLTTPTIDGDLVYVSEREGWIHCLRAATGEVVWEKRAAKEFELTVPQWGFSASPLVLGERVILNYGRVFAFDKKSGAPVWKTQKSYGDAYSTPVDLALGGKRALAVFAGEGLVLLSEEDGSELGLVPWKTKHDVNAMTPVVLGSTLFISSGYDHGCALIDLSAGTPRVLWENKVMQNQMSGAVPWEGHLYGFDDQVLKCIDLQGQELWRERGLGQGALAIADGRLIVLSEEGELIVAQADPAGYRELSRRKVLEGGVCWTVPVLANGRIYVRNHAGEVVALDHRAQ